MDLKEIKRIIEMVEGANISSLAIEQDNLKIEIKKELPQPQTMMQVPIHPQVHAPIQQGLQQQAEPTKPVETKRDANLIAITSPMVGTFYTSPTPDSPTYVKVGDSISTNQVVCIIEAMKIFNEIESEISGVVEKICIENATPVEYGQELFLIRKA